MPFQALLGPPPPVPGACPSLTAPRTRTRAQKTDGYITKYTPRPDADPAKIVGQLLVIDDIGVDRPRAEQNAGRPESPGRVHGPLAGCVESRKGVGFLVASGFLATNYWILYR